MRWRRLEKEFGDDLIVEWRSFLLRPHPGGIPRDLGQFRAYTESWKRPAADADGGTFRVWATDEGPPTHSVPPHLVAKAAAALGKEAFDAMDERLLHAYFAENRDVSDPPTLLALWREAGLPEEGFAKVREPALLERVLREHDEAVGLGINGVPAARLADNEAAVVGAHPIEVYRRWIGKVLDGSGKDDE